MDTQLTEGVIWKMYNKQLPDKPVVQVIEIKLIKPAVNSSQSTSVSNRYRLTISDGTHYQTAMVAATLNSMLVEDEFEKYSVIQLNKFTCITAAQQNIVVITELEVVEKTVPAKIRNPKDVALDRPLKKTIDVSRKKPLPPEELKSFIKSEPIQQQPPIPQPPPPTKFWPIQALNPYTSSWAIKARVTAKSDMKKFNSKNGEGQLFSVDLLDSCGSQIKATAFKDEASRLFPILNLQGVYIISKGTVKPANQKYSSHLKHMYELTLDKYTKVYPVAKDDESIIQHEVFSFESIAALEKLEANTVVDILAIVTDVGCLLFFARLII